MSDKQNFQAVINCAAELPVGGYLYPKTAVVTGKQLTLSEMLRSTATHIEEHGLNADGQLVQVVRIPHTASAETDVNVTELTADQKQTTGQPDQVSNNVLPFATADKEELYQAYHTLVTTHFGEFLDMLNGTIVADEITPETDVQEQFADRFKREHKLAL